MGETCLSRVKRRKSGSWSKCIIRGWWQAICQPLMTMPSALMGFEIKTLLAFHISIHPLVLPWFFPFLCYCCISTVHSSAFHKDILHNYVVFFDHAPSCTSMFLLPPLPFPISLLHSPRQNCLCFHVSMKVSQQYKNRYTMLLSCHVPGCITEALDH